MSTTRTDTAHRVIGASPDTIYRAFLDADSLMSWLPPNNMTGRVLELEPREGGRYRFELRYNESGAGKSSEQTDISKGRFLEMVDGRRIKQSVEFESDDPSFAGEMTMTWTFEAASGGTKVTVTAENVPSGIRKEDHDVGLASSLENLATFVER